MLLNILYHMKAFVFPGQGAQFSGMGKGLYNSYPQARELFEKADDILGFRITDTMFEGSDEELKQTKVTQPAIFIHSVILSICHNDFSPQMVAGHSLGEFSALVAAKALSFEDGLRLVSARAKAMQKACEIEPSTMAAILGLDDATVEKVCAETPGVVVPANYNTIGQLVISGSLSAINQACESLKAAGAKRAIILAVGGAFHSPLMEPARQELAAAIDSTVFSKPICPIYQNVDAQPHTCPDEIKRNLILQLTAPVRWRQSVENIWSDGGREFIELGPGNVLQNMIKKILPESTTNGYQ
ncbi:Malonyl CoA-acyl carrier protein transacylase [Bacteroidales bacterium CF]|nr:Malonyl CoA-acyl carrier protein transacylase [Bacteroidales bacterium CF]